jgi:hypothetical protein
MLGAISELLATVVKSGTGIIKRRQELKAAKTENEARLLRDEQSHNQAWEMRALTNAGWKDEALFILIMAMWVYSAIDPEGAKVVFQNWKEAIPEWYQKITMWLVASIIGVKKIGDYGPALIAGIKTAIKK